MTLAPAPPVDEQHHSDSTATLAVVAALSGVLAASLPSMIVAAALPEIAADLGTTIRVLTWALSAPLIACAIALPAFGKLSDLLGHRRLFIVAISATALFSAATAAAPGPLLFIVGRVLTQVAAVAAQPSAVAMLRASVTPARRPMVFTMWAFTMSVGPALGLIVGGLMVDSLGWPAMFLLQAAIAAIAAALALRTAPMPSANQGTRFDAVGAVLLGIAAFSCLVLVDRGFDEGWTDRLVVAVAVIAAAAVGALVVVERNQTSPLVPRRLARSRTFQGALGAQFCMQCLILGTIALVPVLLRNNLDYSASRTSIVIVAIPAGFGLVSPLGGRLAYRRPRLLVAAGAAMMIAGMALLAFGSHTESVPLVAAALFLLGVGAGTGRTVFVLAVTNAGGIRDVGIASGLERLSGQVGGAFGVAAFVGMAISRGGTADAVGVAAALAVSIAAISLVLALVTPGLDVASLTQEEVPGVEPVGLDAIAP